MAMAFILGLYRFFIVLVYIQIVKSQEQPTLETICEFPLNNATWNAIGIGTGFLQSFGSDQQPAIDAAGYQAFLLSNLPGAIADSYTCEATARCDITPLNRNCNQNPAVATVLKAMANWSNFYQSLIDLSVETTNFIGAQAARMADIFLPEGEIPPPDKSNLQQARTAIILGNFFSVILGLLPPLKAIKDGLSFQRDVGILGNGLLGVVPTLASDPVLTARYDQFADIAASTGSLQLTITEGIRRTIRDQLTNRGIFQETESSIIAEIQAGEFAAPIGDLDEELRRQLIAVLASPAINEIWNTIRVVLVKFSRGTFGAGGDPCGGVDLAGNPALVNPIFEGQKFCDADGNALVLRRIPDLELLQAQNNLNIAQGTPYDVPGQDNLADFNLAREVIMDAIIKNQGKNGYLGAPPDDNAVLQQLLGLDFLQTTLSDSLFFNVPFCDYTKTDITPELRGRCESRFPILRSELEMCEFNLFMLCICPGQTIVAGQTWPYQTAQSEQCTV